MSGAIIAGYSAIIGFFVIKSKLSSTPEPEPIVAAPVVKSTSVVPSVDSDEFGAYIENEDNLMKWVESAE